MYVVANRVPVAQGWEEKFETRFHQRAGQVEQQPGFVRMQILKPMSDNTPYVVLTFWQDEPAFLSWVESDDFKEAHKNPLPKEAFDGAGGLEKYAVIISTDKSEN